jgi:hypothetical protein
MTSFPESNTVEALIRDLLCGPQPPPKKGLAELPAIYLTNGLARRGAGWHFVPSLALTRQLSPSRSAHSLVRTML